MFYFSKTKLKNAIRDHERNSTMSHTIKSGDTTYYLKRAYKRKEAVAEVRYRIQNKLPLMGWQ